MRSFKLGLVAAVVAALTIGTPGLVSAQNATPEFNAADFSPVVTNPFFPLATVHHKVYQGEETDADTGKTVQTGVEETVLPETKMVAGVEVTVVEAKDLQNGEVVEITWDYYAQHRDGTVYYFGEDVDDLEDGTVVGHGGAWLAGEGDNLPGIFMPPVPEAGQTFQQERAPGIAEDTTTVLAIDQSVETRVGPFSGCLRTEDINPLDGATENKYVCTGVGLVREEYEDGYLDLVRFEGGNESSAGATPAG